MGRSEPLTITQKEAAEILGIGRPGVAKLIADGFLTLRSFGGSTRPRLLRSEVVEFAVSLPKISHSPASNDE